MESNKLSSNCIQLFQKSNSSINGLRAVFLWAESRQMTSCSFRGFPVKSLGSISFLAGIVAHFVELILMH